MISTTEKQTLDNLISSIPTSVKLENKYFSKEEIVAQSEDDLDFQFTSFKRFLNTTQKWWCSKCDSSFPQCDHGETKRTEKTVYTINASAIASQISQTIEQSGPLNDVREKSTVDGIYAIDADFGDERIAMHFYSDEDSYQGSQLHHLELEFPVLLRELQGPIPEEYTFNWRDLLSSRFREQLSETISSIRNKTAATFATYDEEFVYNHRTELRSSIRNYFDKSGYTTHDEIATHCPEISDYGISAKQADFVCTKDGDDDEKILVSHGEVRDNGWYVQRFVDSRLGSVEEEKVYIDLRDQVDEKVTYYKKIKDQLGTTTRLIRGVAAFAGILTAIIAVTNMDELTEFVTTQSPLAIPEWSINLFLLTNIAVVILLGYMLASPYVRSVLFSWSMYSAGVERPWSDIHQHMKHRTD